jgi:hypothetical protein
LNNSFYDKMMKKKFFIFLFFVVGGFSKVISQTADISISYASREIQISLAKEYNKELSNSLPKFAEYAAVNTTFYEATKTGTATTSSFAYAFPKNPCSSCWGLIKLSRCRKKISLLQLTDRLVRSIPLTNTDYNQISAVKSRITLKAGSILREINKELLNN